MGILIDASDLFGNMRQLTKDEIKSRNKMYTSMSEEDQELIERLNNGGYLTNEDLED